jgi:hypothetical protein
MRVLHCLKLAQLVAAATASRAMGMATRCGICTRIDGPFGLCREGGEGLLQGFATTRWAGFRAIREGAREIIEARTAGFATIFVNRHAYFSCMPGFTTMSTKP